MEWIKKFASLKIKNDPFFGEESIFTLFEKDSNRLAIVYGENGSGKSTITNSFKQIANSDNNVQLLDRANKSLVIDDNDLFIFNEDYVNNKVKIEGSGVDSILLIGEQIEIDTQINELKLSEVELNNKILDITTKIDSENLKTNKESYSAYFEKCKTKLRTRWAVKDSKILSNKHNSSVNDEKINSIAKTSINEDSLEELQKQLDVGIKELIASTNFNEPFNVKIENVCVLENGIDELITKLLEQVNNNLIVEQENVIPMDLLNDINSLNKTKTFFEDDKCDKCKLCYQDISAEWKSKIITLINSAVGNENIKLVNKLSEYEICEYDFAQYNILRDVDSETFDKISGLMARYNVFVKKHNEIIENKKSKLNRSLNYMTKVEFNEFNNLIIQISDEINRFNNTIDQINKAINDKATKQKQLQNLNDKIAYLEIIGDYNIYLKKRSEYDELVKQKTEFDEQLQNIKNDIGNKKQQMENYNLAMDDINDLLYRVFYSEERMVLVPGDQNNYKLKINGEYVKPSKISTGERNVLALCYFFVELAKGEKESEKYSKQKLVVIDDPISSFDIGNKLGMFIAIKSELDKMLEGCEETKCILLTHDIQSLYNLDKIFEFENDMYQYFELKKKKIFKFNVEKYYGYSNNINTILDFIMFPDQRAVILNTIGNTLRIVIEMFFTFNFCDGIVKVLNKKEVIAKLGDKKKNFDPLVVRMMLNNGSHGRIHIQKNDEVGFNMIHQEEELVKIAKDVIRLMDILVPGHIKSHLSNDCSETYKKKIEELLDF
jgi:wobble nucleotide-excising tRNase